jgi:PBSX family phage terminase large subunit
MVLHPIQKIIAKDTHRYRVLCLGRRTGKTFLSVVEMIGQAVANKDGLVSYVAPTYKQARDIAWQELKKETRGYAIKINEARLEIIIPNHYGGESMIDLRGWESIESLRGQKRHFLVLDEVAMYRNFWVNWQEVLRPLLTDYKGGCMFASTPKGYNHFYDLYNLEQTNENFKSFHYTSYNNPYIDANEIEEARKDMTVDRFAQEYLADFRKAEGLVYPEFSRDIHVVDDDKIPQFKEIICGVDFGYTNPSAILKIGVDFDNNYWIVDEWYKTQQTKEQLIVALGTMNPNYVYPDPEDAEGVAKLQEAGFNVMPVNKNKIEGINKVRECIKQGRLRVKRGCINFLEEIESYHYPDDNGNGNLKEEPVKEKDHLQDSLKYCLYNHDVSKYDPLRYQRVERNRRTLTSFD